MQIRLTDAAYADLERLEDYLAVTQDPMATHLLDFLFESVAVLERHPGIGRPVGGGYRELIIQRGRSGYLARYRVVEGGNILRVLRIRHQRESGYTEDEI